MAFLICGPLFEMCSPPENTTALISVYAFVIQSRKAKTKAKESKNKALDKYLEYLA